MGLNGMERPRAATREARSIDGRRSDGRMRARPGEAGARSEARRSVAVGDARRRRGIAAFASFPGARDGRGGLARRRSAPRGRPGGGGGGRGGGGADEPESGAPRARTRRVSVSRDGVARDATRRSIGGAARDEAGRDAPRAVRELLVGARHVPRGGRPVAHDRHPARGARASRWNAARSERRPTDDQGVLARAKGRFAQTEHLSGCSTRERRRPENIIFCARAYGERFVLFSYEHREYRKTRPPRSSSRRSFPRSTGYDGLYRSSHPRAHVLARTLALTFSRSRCFRLYLYVAVYTRPASSQP